MVVLENIRKDVAEFFSFLVEKCLAKDTFEAGEVTVISADRWVLTNIAELLSLDGIVCSVNEAENGVCELKVHTVV